MEMIVNTVRMVDYDQTNEYSKGNHNTLKEKLAVGFLNPMDFKNLKLRQDLNLKLISNFGNVVIKPYENKNVPMGVINMPVSIWANQITRIDNDKLKFKNLKLKVEITEDPILNLDEIINSIKK